jgi:hypothetical protein
VHGTVGDFEALPGLSRPRPFFEFIKNIASVATNGDTVRPAPVLLGAPANGVVEVAGPEQVHLDALIRKPDGLLRDRQTLTAERDGLVHKKAGLLEERARLTSERDVSLRERQTLTAERDGLLEERGHSPDKPGICSSS